MSGTPGYPRCRGRVAAYAPGRRVDDGAATGGPEQHRLLDGGVLVDQHEVVPAAEGVVPGPRQVVQADRLESEAALGCGLGLLEYDREVEEQVLVGRGSAQRLRRDRAEHRLDHAAHRKLLRRDAGTLCQPVAPVKPASDARHPLQYAEPTQSRRYPCQRRRSSPEAT